MNQNNAAQAANENPLSDEYVNAIIQRHGYDSPETVIARLAQWIGLNGGENGVTLLMYEAHKALSKLRAPVADERAAFKKYHSAIIKALSSIARADGPDTRKEDDPELLYRSPVMDDVVRIRVALDECSAALARAPVASGAQIIGYVPPIYLEMRRRGMPVNSKVQHSPVDDATAPLYAAPQASAEPPKLPTGWQLALGLAIDAIENAAPMDWPVNWPLIRHGLVELRDALKQPQAAQDGGQQRGGDVDDREAWAADMVAAGAKHLGDECWEWESDDFLFHLWQVATRRQQQAVDVDERAAFEAWAYRAGMGPKFRESMFAAWEARAALSATQPEQGERDA